MKKAILFAFCMVFLSRAAMAMYGEDTAPSESDTSYTEDKESPETVTLPEMETEMPEAMQEMREEQKSNPEENYIEDDVDFNLQDEKERFGE